MRFRPRISLIAAALCFALTTGCHKSKDVVEGAFIGAGGQLIISVDDDGAVVFVSVLGEGTCIPIDDLGSAELDGDEIVFEDDTSITVELSSNTITLVDAGPLSGPFTRVDPETVCFVNVPPPGPVTAGSFEVTPGPARALGSNGHVRTAEITIGADVGTLAVYLIGHDVGWYQIEPRTFKNPSGVDLFASEPYLTDCSTTFCSVLLPKIPGVTPVAGKYTFEFGGEGNIDDVRVIVVTRPLPIDNTTVRLHVVVGPTDHSMADIMNALTTAVSYYATIGITVVLDPVVNSTNPDFATVPAEFLNPRTTALSQLGQQDAINVFIVDDLAGVEGLYGMAAGISGTLGVVGPWNGVLVSITTHENDPTVPFSQGLRETIVHEAGHLLGLYHTTESDGTSFDPLDDTAECPANIFDGDMDHSVLADECETAGGDNVMFWTPSVTAPPAIPQTILSNHQIYVLDHVVVGN